MEIKLSVSKCLNQIKNLLEGEFRNITIVGEVTNLTSSAAGHWYFSLSDKEGTINSALFKMDAYRNPLIRKIKNGDLIICSGSIGVYTKRGTFQIIARKILPAGIGNLKEQFEELKKNLSSEGLFDLEAKRPIPRFPKKIAIITAEGSAALADFLNIFKRRCLWMDIMVIPALVQGEAAPALLRQALRRAEAYHQKQAPLDVVVLARGGGSLEDLWAFNDEGLARDIYKCSVPIISAVGHQVDFSMSDFVADMRCETPSSAAEVLTEEQTKIKENLIILQRRIFLSGKAQTSFFREKLAQYNPQKLSVSLWRLFKQAERRLEKSNLTHRLVELTGFYEMSMQLDELLTRLNLVMKEKMRELEFSVKKNDGPLRALNPQNILKRGYSYVVDEDEKVISSIKNFAKIKENSKIKLYFSDGMGEVRK